MGWWLVLGKSQVPFPILSGYDLIIGVECANECDIVFFAAISRSRGLMSPSCCRLIILMSGLCDGIWVWLVGGGRMRHVVYAY